MAWEAPVSRVEIGGGYYLQRNAVARLSWQHNDREGGRTESDSLVAAQLLVLVLTCESWRSRLPRCFTDHRRHERRRCRGAQRHNSEGPASLRGRVDIRRAARG